MIKGWIYLLALAFLLSCKHKPVLQPVWLHKTDSIAYPGIQLQFETPYKNWSATLATFTQPIPLVIEYNNTGFTAVAKTMNGIIEGPGQICLSNGSQFFYYPVMVTNNKHYSFTHKDYRSPKTVNPDSSLIQQRIIHNIDSCRNIIFLPNRNWYFFEENIRLSPRANVYRAIADQAITAYYVQPGSCVNIPLQATYDKAKDEFTVIAGPLKDKDDNLVANGTSIAFTYTDNLFTHRMETTLIKGYATVIIPAEKKGWRLQANIHKTFSTVIPLTH